MTTERPLEALRDDILELRRKRNGLRAWSTTNSDSPLLRAMAAEAGQSVSAWKRHAGELADDAEVQLAVLEDAEAKLSDIEQAKTANRAELQHLEAEHAQIRAQLEVLMSPEERALEAEVRDAEAELRTLDAELKGIDRRLARLWEAICGTIEGDGYTLLAHSMAATPPAKRERALRQARTIINLPVIG